MGTRRAKLDQIKIQRSLLALGKKGHRRSCIGKARMFINNDCDSLIITGSNLQVHPVGTCHRENVEA